MSAPVPRPPSASRAWLVPMLAVVAIATTAVEWAFQRFPIAPGVDPGDWIQRSYAWVGLPAVTPDAVGSPYLYPPVMFPLLGGVVRLTGGPVAAGFVFGGLLLVAFGLTTVHLARRFFTTGPVQLLFVGLALLNGTTLSILFWGGYPNFLAFAVFNEALVLLLAFFRTRTTLAGVGFWAVASLLYLTHTLTFVVLLTTVLLAFLLLAAVDRSYRRLPLARGNLYGVPILVATVVGYALALRYFHIEAPGYLGSNPTSYVLENLGQIFRPLGSAPTFSPAGPAVAFSPTVVLGLFLGLAAAIALGAFLLGRRLKRAEPTWYLAAGYLMASLLIPVGGWLAHVDTDYTRFVYFFPEPVALSAGLVVEPFLSRFVSRGGTAPTGPGDPAAPAPSAPGRAFPWAEAQSRGLITSLAVLVVLALLLGGVTIPTVTQAEKGNANTAHDAQFLDALHFLAGAPGNGSVLTLQNSIRWTEAVTTRGGFDVGPTWLLFEPWQIVNAEETYWAFNSRYALTNNLDVLSYSGGYQGVDSAPWSTAPLYSVYADGVATPMVELGTPGLLVNATVGGVSRLYAAGSWAAPTLTVRGAPPGGAPVAYLNFTGPLFDLTETGSPGASAGPGATVGITVAPARGVTVGGIQIDLTAPPNATALLHAPESAGVVARPAGVDWSMSALLGPDTSPTVLTTHVSFAPAPRALAVSGPTEPNAVATEFQDPTGGAFSVALTFTTPGTGGNPAIVLPSLLDTAAFLAAHHITYLLLPRSSAYAPTVAFFEQEFAAHLLYTNSEWEVLSE